jgi:hypothetical protein
LIRYFTDCSVIGNNFRLTPHDVQKFEESERLLSLPLERVLREQPATRYVLARITAPDEQNSARRGLSDAQVIAWLRQANPPLFSELMLQARTGPAIVQPMLSVNARFAETHLVEHVTLFRTADLPSGDAVTVP